MADFDITERRTRVTLTISELRQIADSLERRLKREGMPTGERCATASALGEINNALNRAIGIERA